MKDSELRSKTFRLIEKAETSLKITGATAQMIKSRLFEVNKSSLKGVQFIYDEICDLASTQTKNLGISAEEMIEDPRIKKEFKIPGIHELASPKNSQKPAIRHTATGIAFNKEIAYGGKPDQAVSLQQFSRASPEEFNDFAYAVYSGFLNLQAAWKAVSKELIERREEKENQRTRDLLKGDISDRLAKFRESELGASENSGLDQTSPPPSQESIRARP